MPTLLIPVNNGAGSSVLSRLKCCDPVMNLSKTGSDWKGCTILGCYLTSLSLNILCLFCWAMLTVVILEVFIKYTQLIFDVSRTVVGGFLFVCLFIPAEVAVFFFKSYPEAGEMAHQ